MAIVYLIPSLGLFFAILWTRYQKFRAQFSRVFADKHCLITGGSSGLGLAIAESVLERGAKSVTLMARDKIKLNEAKMSLVTMFPESEINIVSVDVTNSTSVIAVFKQCQDEFGIPAFDVIFACAGASKPGFFLQTPSEDFESSMKLNYLGTVYTLQVNNVNVYK